MDETEFAERRGGEDLKTGDRLARRPGRGARPPRRARRGARARAARRSTLGEPTDALADKADAFMALAAVLRAAGRDLDARGAAIGARDLYAAKDHAVGRARAEAAAGLAPSPPSVSPALTALADRGRDPDGEALLDHVGAPGDRRRLRGAARDVRQDDSYVLDDRRHLANHGPPARRRGRGDRRRSAASTAWPPRSSGRCSPARAAPRATCSSRPACSASSGRIAETEGSFEADWGLVVLVRDGLICHGVITDADAGHAARRLRRGVPRVFGGGAEGTTAVERTHAETIACLNEQRWDDLRALDVDEMSLADLRAVGSPPVRGADAVIAMLRDIREIPARRPVVRHRRRRPLMSWRR